MQFDRTIGAVRVVNAGSVGMPFGEPGAYWLLLGPDLRLRRTSYDLVDAARRIRATAFPGAEEFAAGNVLQAAFMVVGSIFVALLQAEGVPVGLIFLGLAVASFGAVWFVFGKWGKEGVRDFGALLFRALFRTEIRGLENLPPAGTRMLIAPNHVSLIDGPLLHAILSIEASFAVDGVVATGGRVLEISPENPRQEISHINPDVFKPREHALAAGDTLKWRFPARSVSVVELECRSV